MNNKKLVFSGVQPTGNLHLGNYLGALKNFVSLQKEMECIYCVVDLHAITVFQDPKHLHNNVLETTASFLATGLDPNKSIIFNQSSVSGHAELAWILNCVSRIGWLNRMTQFKDKAGSDKEKASVGLYIYPNLMAQYASVSKTDGSIKFIPTLIFSKPSNLFIKADINFGSNNNTSLIISRLVDLNSVIFEKNLLSFPTLYS